MNIPLFWKHKQMLALLEGQYGFSLFSAGHLAWLVGIALWIAATAVLYRRLDAHRRDNMRKVMAVILILLETSKLCVMGLTHVDICEFLPIHLCSVAGLFIVIDALWPNTKWVGQMFLFAFNTAALMALICSSVTCYPFFNFYSIHSFVIHGYLLVYAVMRYAAGEFRPTYRGLWGSVAATVAVGIPIFFIDGIFDVNYMFLGQPSDVSLLVALWDVFAPIGGRLLYALSIAVLGTAVIHVLYLVYRIVAICSAARSKKKQEGST